MDEIKQMSCQDEQGNDWQITLSPQEKYPSRSILKFKFNNQEFRLGIFGTKSAAKAVWDCLKTSKKERGQDAKATN